MSADLIELIKVLQLRAEQCDRGNWYVSLSEMQTILDAIAAKDTALSEMRAELERVKTYAHEATKTLTDLVGGGSECFAGRIGEMYVADLSFCKGRIRERDSRAHERLLKSVTERHAAEAELEQRSWRGMDTAPTNGTVIEAVGRYLDATAGFPRYVMFRDGAWFDCSRHIDEVVCWAWRPRTDWPHTALASQDEGEERT